MARLRLRTQLLIANLWIICGLVGALLLVVRHTVRSEIAQEVQQGTNASLTAFENVQQQRDAQLARTAAMLSELPTLKALMTTTDALTIQDASEPLWKLAGTQLFLLASPAPSGSILGFHVAPSNWSAAAAQSNLTKSIEQREDAAWWYGEGRLYRVSLRTIMAGEGNDARQLGILAIGYEVDAGVAQQLAIVSGSDIALTADGKVIASTISTEERAEFEGLLQSSVAPREQNREWKIGDKPYQVASVLIHNGPPASVECYVMMSLDPANAFLRRLNRTIVILGVSAVLLAGLLLGFVSKTITHPLENLVAGVRALAKGDYAYSITPRGSSEVAELGESFSKMRGELLAAEERRFAAERVAAFGRAATSISHDLRHYLAAVVANAEFLYEAEKLRLNRDEVYQEIRTASEQMTDLLDSLRELARVETSISPMPASLVQTVRRAVDAVRARPELRNIEVEINTKGEMDGTFDAKKIERAFFNLVLNACEASLASQGRVRIDIVSAPTSFEVRVSDDGPGVPAAIEKTLFDPFVSFGKTNGTGLGLAIVSKIVHDHRGTVTIESTSAAGTTFRVRFPRTANAEGLQPQALVS
ncbi:MAG: ATP-binding protein [Candidatus Acidiferrales bacterium]